MDREVGERPLRAPDSSELMARAVAVSPVDKLRLLWSAREFLGRTAGIALCLAIVLAFLLPAEYTSTTRIMPPEPDPFSGMGMISSLLGGGGGGSSAGSALGSTASDLLGLKSSGPPYASILGSRTVADRVIDRFDLMHRYKTRYRVNARKKLAGYTDISEDKKTGIITVTVSDRDPNRAAAMARSYIEELSRLAADLNTSAAHREREFIEGRLRTVKQDLDQASKEFSEFSSKNATLDIKEQGQAMVEAGAVLQGQLIAAQSELEGLQQVYTGNNVRVRSLQARIDELKRQLDKIAGTDASLAADKAADKNGSTLSRELYPSIRQLPLLGVQYADLYRRAKIQETVYELLTQQYEMSKVQEAKEMATVKVLDEADVPEKRSFPSRTLVVILGTLMSVALASAWLLAKHRWDLTDPLDARKMFAQEIYTTSMSACQSLWSAMRRDRRGTV
jgi:uncharacterized protein involved in exopolysaccharide biosynthesis